MIEANHDKARLLAGPYPWYLKQRILGPTGHLSNEQTGEALTQVLDDGPCWLWLAHLSRTNNTPDLARAQVSEMLRSRGLKHIKPAPLPREIGPVWDTASLWGGEPAPADAREGKTPLKALPRLMRSRQAMCPVSHRTLRISQARASTKRRGHCAWLASLAGKLRSRQSGWPESAT